MSYEIFDTGPYNSEDVQSILDWLEDMGAITKNGPDSYVVSNEELLCELYAEEKAKIARIIESN